MRSQKFAEQLPGTKFTTYLQKIFNTFMFVLFRESDGQCIDNKGQGIPEGLLFTPGTLKTWSKLMQPE